jgi:hypothetical protein
MNLIKEQCRFHLLFLEVFLARLLLASPSVDLAYFLAAVSSSATGFCALRFLPADLTSLTSST